MWPFKKPIPKEIRRQQILERIFDKYDNYLTEDEFIDGMLKINQQAIEKLRLHKLPCKLTENDYLGINKPETTKKKYEKFRNYLDERKKVESIINDVFIKHWEGRFD